MDDWTFCLRSLGDVSRTFSIPIGMLRERLRLAVTCGYLLCRVIDTVEDEADLELTTRDALYAVFLRVIERQAPAEDFVRAFAGSRGDTAEHRLARELPRVLRVLDTLPDELTEIVRRWVAEMARGMVIYSHRPVGEDGMTALATLRDLDRYCYFVAGTVGHMLTELFTAELPALDPLRLMTLRAHAEEFGLGLQLVNILKDITDDHARGWSFIPRTLCAHEGIGVRDLLYPSSRAAAHRVLAPLFDRAQEALDDAFTYTLAIPPGADDVRQFCLLPLWMAVRTLALARGNDDGLIPGRPVKISRAEIDTIVRDCMARCRDDQALRQGYRQLTVAPTRRVA